MIKITNIWHQVYHINPMNIIGVTGCFPLRDDPTRKAFEVHINGMGNIITDMTPGEIREEMLHFYRITQPPIFKGGPF